MKDNSFSFSGGTISELVEEKKTSGAGGWPIIAEETCFVFLEDILKGLAFLLGIGLVHGDIKGNIFARNHLRLEMIISLQILFLFIGSHLSPSDFSGNESRAWSLSASDKSFQKLQTIKELFEEVDMLYSNHPEIKLV